MAQLHYKFVGDCARPVVVFLHGFLGSCADWQEVITGLGDRYAYLLIDLPGHGASLLEDATQYSIEGAAQAVLDVLGDKIQPYLYGYSMGGRLALYLALHHAESFRKVMVESASPGLANVNDRYLRQSHDDELARRLENLASHELKQFLAHWYSQPLFQSLRDHDCFAPMLQRRTRNAPQFLAKSLRHMGIGVQPSLWEQLSNVAIPIHFLTGELDQKFVQLQSLMRQACPPATSSVIQQTGHNVHLENPAAIIREITNFFVESDT